jgi:hypothetical protein
LSEDGHKFAAWLISKGRKCDFFWSEYGGWGTPKPNGFAAGQIKEMQSKKELPEPEGEQAAP